MNRKVLGIDLGTTNCCIAVIEGNKKIKIITNNEGKRTTPSVVSFDTDGSYSIGDAAKRKACTNTLNTIFAFKRLIGKKYSEVSHLKKNLPFEIVPDKNGQACVKVNGKILTPVEISASLLRKLSESASAYTGQPAKGTPVVVTIPARFGMAQREATKDACEIANLKVLRIINEPTAAAVAYGLEKIDEEKPSNENKDKDNSRKIIIYDLGGGTFDVTIIEFEDGVFQVLTTDGDPELGGEDFDEALTEYVLNKFTTLHPNNRARQDRAAMYRVREACKEAKEGLSISDFVQVSVPYICEGPLNLDITITVNEFQTLIQKYIDQTMETVKKVCKEKDIKYSDFYAVVLVGGSTRIPLIRKELAKLFDKRIIKQDINPDEVVAQGAAIQGGILSGNFKDVVLIDALSLSLGIESFGGIMTPILEKTTPIPTQKSKIFTTAQDNQPEAKIAIYQGERKMAEDCRKLGEFTLTGIRPAPKGIPQIEVTFDIDANGLLKVSAKDKDTGKQQEVILRPEVGISDEEKKKMIKDAEDQLESDLAKEKLVLAKHELDSTIYTITNEQEKNKDVISNEFSEKIETFKTESKQIVEDTSITDVNKYSEQTNKGYEIIKELSNLAKSKTQEKEQTKDKDETSAKAENTEEETKE